MLKVVLSLLVFVAVFISCTKVQGPLIVQKPKAFDCNTANITYSLHVKPIIGQHCALTGCHDAFGSAPGNFDLYSDIKFSIDAGFFQDRTFTKKDMPVTYPLPDSLITILQCWIDKGALNN